MILAGSMGLLEKSEGDRTGAVNRSLTFWLSCQSEEILCRGLREIWGHRETATGPATQCSRQPGKGSEFRSLEVAMCFFGSSHRRPSWLVQILDSNVWKFRPQAGCMVEI